MSAPSSRKTQRKAPAPPAAPPAATPEAASPPERPWWNTLVTDAGTAERALTLTAHFGKRCVVVQWIALTFAHRNAEGYSLRFDTIEIRVAIAKARNFPEGDFLRAIQVQTLLEVFHMPERGMSVSAVLRERNREGKLEEVEL